MTVALNILYLMIQLADTHSLEDAMHVPFSENFVSHSHRLFLNAKLRKAGGGQITGEHDERFGQQRES